MESNNAENTSLLMHSSGSAKPFLDQLPKQCFWDDLDLYQWHGFWYLPPHLEAAKTMQSHFEACNEDIILASHIKTGTNWLKALCFSIMQRQKNANDVEEEDPLAQTTPALCIRTLEVQVYTPNSLPSLSGMTSPRLFHTHLPYSALPDSIKNSGCKIVYITRSPKDTLVSMWHFLNTLRTPEQGPYPFERAFEDFCDGLCPYGPFFDHVMEYWKESLKVPQKVLFLKYEDLKRDPKGELKRLASFIGRPFGVEEEDEIDKLVWRCSFERLKNLEVNKNGVEASTGFQNRAFFRLGVVGDWKNNFTVEMKERLDQLTLMQLQGSGLKFGT